MGKSKTKIKTKIDRVEPTSEVLTSRAGLPFFVRYLEKINIYSSLERYFGSIRKHHKGIEVTEAFKQLDPPGLKGLRHREASLPRFPSKYRLLLYNDSFL